MSYRDAFRPCSMVSSGEKNKLVRQKEQTEIKYTIDFVVFLFIIGGISIEGEDGLPATAPNTLLDYAYDFWPVNAFSFLI